MAIPYGRLPLVPLACQGRSMKERLLMTTTTILKVVGVFGNHI